MLKEIIKKNRSIRRFHPEKISVETLRDLVDLARLSASAANLQPLRYVLSCEEEKNEKIFSCLAWAGYLNDWPGPSPEERPAGYIVILGDTSICKNFGCDHGIVAQSMMLGATEAGLGGCMIASIKRDRLREELKIDERYEILLILALGRPAETVVIDEIGSEESIKYWRDEADLHHVPKRKLADIILDL